MEKDVLVEKLERCGAIQFGRFVLTSGAVSDYYIDIKRASTDPETLKLIAEYMIPFAEGYDLLAGMELGAVPLVVALSLQTSIPYVIIRKEKKQHGTAREIEGEDVNGKKILVIEDVTTSGGSVLKAIRILRENGGFVDKVVVVVDRESGASQKLKEIGVTLTPLLTVNDILKK